ncbi:hypothetical protein GCM10009117_24630 [Gangjinia marincola]|uniref:Secretion system C-terminal sorting domain-containing protein n=2 Tax=Gangjinia marincola TaxID=578463 RepID=A0ABN1MJA7_9FLAO
MQAQFTDDFDSYNLGDLDPQSTLWDVWPGGESSIVTDEEAFSGSNSMLVPEGGTVDMLLLLGDQTSGVWSIRWQMYVPNGKTGFWNYQQIEADPGGQFNGQVFVSNTASGGTAGNITYDFDGTETPFPFDQWFDVLTVIDLDNLTISIAIDGDLSLDAVPYIDTDGNPATQLGSIDFFSIDANNRYFIDDVVFTDENLVLDNQEFEASDLDIVMDNSSEMLRVSALNNIRSIEIFNILGSTVHTSSVNKDAANIDMNTISSGVYIVKVIFEGGSISKKIVKK